MLLFQCCNETCAEAEPEHTALGGCHAVIDEDLVAAEPIITQFLQHLQPLVYGKGAIIGAFSI